MRTRFTPRVERPSVCESLECRRLLAAGVLDTSFGGDGKVTISSGDVGLHSSDVAVQSDGKTVVVGRAGNRGLAVARILLDGSPDTSFGPNQDGTAITPVNGEGVAVGVGIQADGKIVAVGAATQEDAVVRYNPDGTLDRSFDGDGIKTFGWGDFTFATGVTFQNDGKIVIVGGAVDLPAVFSSQDRDVLLARLNPEDGSFDQSFGNFGMNPRPGMVKAGFGDYEEGSDVEIDYTGTPATNPSYGKIVVVGTKSTDYDNMVGRLLVARFNGDGRLDPAFDGDGSRQVSYGDTDTTTGHGVLILPDGDYVAVGSSDGDIVMTRFFPNGAIDTSFGPIGNGWVTKNLGGNDVGFDAIQSTSGGLVVVGASDQHLTVTGYTANGSTDSSFLTSGFVILNDSSNVDPNSLLGAGIAAGPGKRFTISGGSNFYTARFLDTGANLVVLGSFLDTSASETGPDAASFYVGRPERLPTPQRVYLQYSGTAQRPGFIGRDFVASSNITFGNGLGTLTYVDIPANETFTLVTITPIDDDLSEGQETATFSIIPSNAYDIGSPNTTTLTIDDNEAAPATHVTQVFVNGPGLTGGSSGADQSSFRAQAGIDTVYGYPVPAGAAQTRTIPWVGGVNSVSIRFDQNVAGRLDSSDLQVGGAATGSYSPSSFGYDPGTRTGTWHFATPILNDKLRLVLDDAHLASLDGEWTNPSAPTAGGDSYPSGDGTIGGDFNFRVNVLTGDATGDGRVNALDLSSIKQRLNRTATNPGTGGGAYSFFADVTADGRINALDLAAVKQRLNRALPAAEPAAML